MRKPGHPMGDPGPHPLSAAVERSGRRLGHGDLLSTTAPTVGPRGRGGLPHRHSSVLRGVGRSGSAAPAGATWQDRGMTDSDSPTARRIPGRGARRGRRHAAVAAVPRRVAQVPARPGGHRAQPAPGDRRPAHAADRARRGAGGDGGRARACGARPAAAAGPRGGAGRALAARLDGRDRPGRGGAGRARGRRGAGVVRGRPRDQRRRVRAGRPARRGRRPGRLRDHRRHRGVVPLHGVRVHRVGRPARGRPGRLPRRGVHREAGRGDRSRLAGHRAVPLERRDVPGPGRGAARPPGAPAARCCTTACARSPPPGTPRPARR